MSAQQSADRSGADPDPELAQLALDPHVAPPGILPREPHDDRAELGIDGRATDVRAAVRPFAPDELAVPAQEGLRRDEER